MTVQIGVICTVTGAARLCERGSCGLFTRELAAAMRAYTGTLSAELAPPPAVSHNPGAG